jgi:hypothetical protein
MRHFVKSLPLSVSDFFLTIYDLCYGSTHICHVPDMLLLGVPHGLTEGNALCLLTRSASLRVPSPSMNSGPRYCQILCMGS